MDADARTRIACFEHSEETQRIAKCVERSTNTPGGLWASTSSATVSMSPSRSVGSACIFTAHPCKPHEEPALNFAGSQHACTKCASLFPDSMTGLPDLIHKLLGAQCKLYVTRCATRELEELGEGFEKAFQSSDELSLTHVPRAPLLRPHKCKSLVAGDARQGIAARAVAANETGQSLDIRLSKWKIKWSMMQPISRCFSAGIPQSLRSLDWLAMVALQAWQERNISQNA
eukprot:1142781-Pelagomonas_calceolata.AAC.5